MSFTDSLFRPRFLNTLALKLYKKSILGSNATALSMLSRALSQSSVFAYANASRTFFVTRSLIVSAATGGFVNLLAGREIVGAEVSIGFGISLFQSPGLDTGAVTGSVCPAYGSFAITAVPVKNPTNNPATITVFIICSFFTSSVA